MAQSNLPYDVIFTDIDGTLLNKERELSECTKSVIKKLKDEIPVVLISSRMPDAMRHLQHELGIENQPLICYNGGLTLIDNTPQTSRAIPVSVLGDLLDFNRELDVHLSLYEAENWHVPEMDYWAKREENNTKVTPDVSNLNEVYTDWQHHEKGAHKIMVMGDEEKVEKIKNYLAENYPDELHLYRSKPTYLEIADKRISKLSAVDYLLENHFGSTRERSLAFGDNYNDLEMLKNLGQGVAVGNAKDEVKNVADRITDTGKQDGVAKTLEQIFDDHL